MVFAALSSANRLRQASTFESWFDFSGLKDKSNFEQLLSEERQQYLVKSLHAVLKPFLLRRVKTDVESLMPKKREYILFAPLTPMQRDLYQAILDGTSRSYLEEKAVERLSIGVGSGAATPLSIRSNNGSRKRRPCQVLAHLTRARRLLVPGHLHRLPRIAVEEDQRRIMKKSVTRSILRI